MYMRNQINYEERKGELNVKPKLYRFLHCIIELDIFFKLLHHFPLSVWNEDRTEFVFYFFIYPPNFYTVLRSARVCVNYIGSNLR